MRALPLRFVNTASKQCPFTRIVELLERFPRSHPSNFVHLFRFFEVGFAYDNHIPVKNNLRFALHRVAVATRKITHSNAAACFFPDLSSGRGFPDLVFCFYFAFRERPTFPRVTRPANDCDLFALSVRRISPYESACCADNVIKTFLLLLQS